MLLFPDDSKCTDGSHFCISKSSLVFSIPCSRKFPFTDSNILINQVLPSLSRCISLYDFRTADTGDCCCKRLAVFREIQGSLPVNKNNQQISCERFVGIGLQVLLNSDSSCCSFPIDQHLDIQCGWT